MAGEYPKFIREEPAADDRFGSHKRVAEALASSLFRDPLPRVVGLLGRWGSGKSTVLRFVKEKLDPDDSKDCASPVFVFDTWSHQNDPPRRSFLESFLKFLDARDFSDLKDWQPELDALRHSEQRVETVSTPNISPTGLGVLASFFLVPIGIAFIDHDWLSEIVHMPGTDYSVRMFRLGAALVMAPIIAGFLAYLHSRPITNIFHLRFWTLDNFVINSAEATSLLSITVQQQAGVEQIEQQVIRTLDPTSIEFQQMFLRILKGVRRPKRRFVIVLDNLDRLPGPDAVAFWGTIRSFFLSSREEGYDKDDDLSSVVLILPLDATALSGHLIEGGQDVAHHFIQKTFDFVFSVPKPVFTGWVDYLELRMKEAFGSAATKDWIYQTTSLLAPAVRNTDVTPRRINALVNAIVALKMQWANEIPNAALSYHAIFPDDTAEQFARRLVEQAQMVELFDPEWRVHIAALRYGVAPDVARQVLLEKEFIESIGQLKEQQFLEAMTVTGADIVLDRHLADLVTRTLPSAKAVFGSAYLVSRWKAHGSTVRAGIEARLREASLTIAPITDFGPEIDEGAAAVVASCPQADLARFAPALAEKMSVISDPIATMRAKLWVDLASSFLKAVLGRGIMPPIVKIPSPAEYAIQAIAVMEDPSLLPFFIPAAPAEQVLNKLGEDMRSGRFQRNGSFDAFRRLQDMPTGWDWTPLFNEATSIVSQNSQMANAHPLIYVMIGILARVPGTKGRQVLENVWRKNVLGNLINSFNTHQTDIRGPLIALNLLLEGSATGPGGQSLTNYFSRMSAADVRDMLTEPLSWFNWADKADALLIALQKNPSVGPLMVWMLNWKELGFDLS